MNFARSGFSYDDLNAGYNPDPRSTNDRHINAEDPNDPTGTGCALANWETNTYCHKKRDGQYNPATDLIRTGQRLDVQPKIYKPVRLKNFDILSTLSYRETKYTFPVGDDPTVSRRSIRAEVGARTSFSKIYGDFSSIQSERIKHEIQPEVTATAIPWMDQPKHQFFGYSAGEDTQASIQDHVSDADLNGTSGIQFDYFDRVYDRKLVTFAVTNKFTRKSWENGAPTYFQFLSWKLAQSYDVYKAEQSDQAQVLSDLTSDLKINLSYLQIYQSSTYHHYQKVTDTTTRVRVNNSINDYIELSHSLSYNKSPGTTDVDIQGRNEDVSLGFKKNVRWIDLIGKFIYDLNPQGDSKYLKSWGYGAQVKLPGDCLYVSLTNYQITGGDRNFLLSAAFIWDGKQQTPLPENLLSSYGL